MVIVISVAVALSLFPSPFSWALFVMGIVCQGLGLVCEGGCLRRVLFLRRGWLANGLVLCGVWAFVKRLV